MSMVISYHHVGHHHHLNAFIVSSVLIYSCAPTYATPSCPPVLVVVVFITLSLLLLVWVVLVVYPFDYL